MECGWNFLRPPNWIVVAQTRQAVEGVEGLASTRYDLSGLDQLDPTRLDRCWP
jgi:hypothetical protein